MTWADARPSACGVDYDVGVESLDTAMKFAALIACILFPVAAAAQGPASSRPVKAVAADRQPESSVVANPAVVVLPATTRKAEGHAGGARVIGFPRDVPGLPATWEPLPGGGRVMAAGVRSPGANSLRAGLRIDSIPAGAKLWVRGETGPAVSVVAQASADLHWTPAVAGETVVVEVEIPPGVSPDDVRLGIVQVSHRTAAVERRATGMSSAANLDVSCYPEWSDLSRSVALMDFVKDGVSYSCTGTLIGDAAGTETPYFLTAAHCISTQAAASTLETTWFFRSASCGSQAVNPVVKVVSGGATLLYQSGEKTDMALLRMNSQPPSGAVFSGWWPRKPEGGTQATGIHHPLADLQKISFGSVYTPSFYAHIAVSWNSGLIEPGSSGSGIWLDHPDGGRYLVGVLSKGDLSCGYQSNLTCDFYGRLDLEYPTLKRWIGDSAAAATYQADCLFDWAETEYPDLFAPPSGSTTQAPYYYRHYAGTGAYLGKSSQDDRVYYLGPLSAGGLLDLGALSEWAATAGCR